MIAKTRVLTVDEYFAFDEASEICNEYIDGEIYPMSGGTRSHSLLIASMISILFELLADKACEVYPGLMRVRIDPSKYVYPDLSVVCGQPRFEDANEVTLLNPAVEVEVTSPASMTRDHVCKVELYGSLPSIEGYLILDQERVFAEWCTRAEGGWHLRQFSDQADVIHMDPLGIDLALAQAYRKIGIKD